VLSPLEFMQRLAALVPQPRLTIDAPCAMRIAHRASDSFAATNLERWMSAEGWVLPAGSDRGMVGVGRVADVRRANLD